MTELAAIIAAVLGGGSLLTLAVRRTWSDRDAVNQAWREGRNEARLDAHKEIEELRREYEKRYTELSAHVDRLHAAVIELVQMVPPEKSPEALAILARLGSVPHSTTTQIGEALNATDPD